MYTEEACLFQGVFWKGTTDHKIVGGDSQAAKEDSEVMSKKLRYKKKLLRCVGVSRSMS